MAESVSILLEAEDKASKVIEGVGNALSGMAKIATGLVVAGAAAAGAAIVGLGAAATKAVNAFAESEQVSARLEAQLDALGSAAKVSKQDIDGLATELSKVSGFDDEDLIEGQSTLLRFGDLSKAQFEKASRAATDLAAITGMDVKSAFQQLGIALDNPEQGFGRLKRQIGDLTAAEEEQIKAAMEVGDTLKAQGIILDAVSRKTAGAAAKMGSTWIGQMNKLKTRWGNFWEDLGAEIVPFLGDWLDAVNDFFNDLTEPILRFVKSETFSRWMNNIYDYVFHKLIPSIREFSQRVMGTFNLAIRIAGRFISEFILPSLRRLWLWLQRQIPPAIKMVADFFNQKFLPAVKAVLEWVETTGIPILQKVVDWLKQKIPQAIDTLRLFWYNQLLPALKTVWGWIQTNLFPVFSTLVEWLKTNIPIAIQALSDYWNTTLLPAIQDVWAKIKNDLIPALQESYDWFKEQLPGAVSAYKDELKLLSDAFTAFKNLFVSGNEETGQSAIDWGATLAWVYENVKQQFDFIVAQVNFFLTMITSVFNLIKAVFSGSWDSILVELAIFGNNLTTGVWNLLKKFVSIFMDTSWWPDTKPLGRSIIEGIIAGWREKWDELWATITSGIDALKAKIQELIGYGSPAKEYMKIGQSMAQGIQVGFDGQMGPSAGAISNSLSPGNYGGGRGGGTVNITYAPAISTASPAEFEAAFVPLVSAAMRRVNRGR
jgi:hypothetical protein